MKVVPPLQHVGFRPRLLDLVALDLKKMPGIKSGSRQLLIIVDHFSKFVNAAALPDKTRQTVRRALQSNLFYCYGIHRAMLSDNGGEFRNALIAYARGKF